MGWIRMVLESSVEEGFVQVGGGVGQPAFGYIVNSFSE